MDMLSAPGCIHRLGVPFAGVADLAGDVIGL
jgi:hypothetical protein